MALFGTILEKNNHSFADCIGNLPVMRFPFGTDLRVGNEYWYTPVVDNLVFRGYKYTPYLSGSTAPTPDSFRVTKVTDIKTADTFTVVANQSAIDGATDGATISPNTIPSFVGSYSPCADTSGNYNYTWVVPALQTGFTHYKVSVMNNNTQAVAAVSTHTTVAGIVTWLNANYSAAGTWSNPSGSIIKLVNTTGVPVGLRFELAA